LYLAIRAVRNLADQLYSSYAQGKDARSLAAIVGEEALNERDRLYLKFAKAFEENFVKQSKRENRNLEESLDIGWKLLTILPQRELTRIPDDIIDKYSKKMNLQFFELGKAT
jgi:V/A-type H+-transporting ATPase subunit B